MAEGTATGVIGDVAGFLKPLRWWVKSWWLSNISHADAGRPRLWPEAGADAGYTVYIVDAWVPPPAGNLTRRVHVYTNAPSVRLWLNNQLVGETVVAYWGQAIFPAVRYESGNLTAEAVTDIGSRVGLQTIQTPGAAHQLQLTIMSPSPATGTGVALVADGQDTAIYIWSVHRSLTVLVTQFRLKIRRQLSTSLSVLSLEVEGSWESTVALLMAL